MDTTSGTAVVTKQMLDPIKKLFDDAWRLYRSRLRTCVKIMIVPALILALGQALAQPRSSTAAVGFLITVIGWVAITIAGIAVLAVIAQGSDAKTAVKKGKRLFFPFLWLGILEVLVIVGGFVMLIVPGIILGVWALFSCYTLLLEDKRGLNAILQSREYVRNYWWAIVGRYVVFAIAIGIIAGIAVALLKAVLGAVAGSIIYAIATELLIAPFSAAYLYVLYRNLTAIKPDLAATQATANRSFIMASAIVGLIAPVVIIIIVASFIAAIFSHQPGPGAAFLSHLRHS